MKPAPRPIFGSTNDGRRPRRYHYWRTGYGTPLLNRLPFWVRQAGEYHTRPNYVTSDFEYPAANIQFFYHLAGVAWLEVGGRALQVKPGDLMMLPPDASFSYHAEQGMQHHWIGLEGNWPQSMYQQRRLLSLGIDAEIEQKFVEVREVLILRPPGYALQAISLVFGLLARIAALSGDKGGPESGYPDPVRSALMFLRETYTEPFRATDTAQAAGVSASYLRALFEKWVGESPGQYHTRYRIEQAQRLLSDPSLTIYEVAYHVGFNDARYFSRVFKQMNGVSPSQYARRQSLPD